MKIGFWKRTKKKKQINCYLLSSQYSKIILGSFFCTNNSVSLRKNYQHILTIFITWSLQNAKDEQQLFFVFSQPLYEKNFNLLWKSGWKKGNHAIPANLFNVILPEKDQLHILTFEAETKRFKMLIINVGKKVHKSIGISQTQVATFLCNDVENDGSSCIA